MAASLSDVNLPPLCLADFQKAMAASEKAFMKQHLEAIYAGMGVTSRSERQNLSRTIEWETHDRPTIDGAGRMASITYEGKGYAGIFDELPCNFNQNKKPRNQTKMKNPEENPVIQESVRQFVDLSVKREECEETYKASRKEIERLEKELNAAIDARNEANHQNVETKEEQSELASSILSVFSYDQKATFTVGNKVVNILGGNGIDVIAKPVKVTATTSKK